MKRPLIIVSGLKPSEREPAARALAKLKRPLFLESTSGLKGTDALSAYELQGGEKTLKALDFDSVIRIGSVPTLRYWRDLETSAIPVWHLGPVRFTGLARASKTLSVAGLIAFSFEEWSAAERDADRAIARRRRELLERYPFSEPGWMSWLSTVIPASARVFLGNSLPVREWDFISSPVRDVYANRGANGIDGLISTFAGLSDERKSNWAILGDLSALYDLAGAWAFAQRPVADVNICVINNGGGQIFRRMFRDPMFLNEHALRFEGWAKMFALNYEYLETSRVLRAPSPRVIEIVPSAEDTENFWQEWERG